MANSNHSVTIVVAIIGVVGVLGAAVISNWDKLSGRGSGSVASSNSATSTPAPTPSPPAPTPTPKLSSAPSTANEAGPDQAKRQTKEATRQILSSGQMIMRASFIYDLELGREVDSEKDADFWWESTNEGKYFLTQKGKAASAIIGMRDFESITYEDLRKIAYSYDPLSGSADPVNRLTPGIVVAYRTRHGSYGKLLIRSRVVDQDKNVNLAVSWQTFE